MHFGEVIKILMVVAFFSITIYVGIRCRKHATDVNSFVLGGRSVGPWLTAFAYGTSYFSAVIFIGYAGQFGWKFGVASTWIGIGNALIGSLLAWVVLGRRTRLITQHYGSATMPQFFGKRFESNPLKLGASLIIFVFLIPYTASLFNGLSRLFNMAFNIDYTVCIIIMSVLTCIYVVIGGYMATAINDFIQGIVMLAGIVAVVLAVLNENRFVSAIASLSKVEGVINEIPTNPGAFTSFFGPDPLGLLGVIILTSIGTWGLPQMVGKFYAIKDENSIKKGTIISTIFALIIAGGCYFLGGFGRLYNIDIATDGYDAIIPKMLENLSPILVGVVVVLVLSASMSTLSSLVLSSSSTITIDLIKGNIKKNMTDKQQVSVMRVFLVVFVAISAVIAIFQYSSNSFFIAQLMGLSWGALAGSFLAPFLYGLYWKKATKVSAWICFIFATSTMLANMFFKDYFPTLLKSPINCGAFVMLVGLVIVPVVSLFTRKPTKENVDSAFACYDSVAVK